MEFMKDYIKLYPEKAQKHAKIQKKCGKTKYWNSIQ